jgi:ketosteroid isomerase-like protein
MIRHCAEEIMNQNEQVIHAFYEGFRARNAEAMVACYHHDVIFADPVFGQLAAPCAMGMWRMLCARAADLTITFDAVSARTTEGSAQWEARCAFSKRHWGPRERCSAGRR